MCARLPEHPGGSTIIPQQALNVEAGRFFEIYHSSRESFTFLKHFYVGELRPEDRDEVPLPRSARRRSGSNDDDDAAAADAAAADAAADDADEGEGEGEAIGQLVDSEPASPEFLVALRECTNPFRRSFTQSKHKSF